MAIIVIISNPGMSNIKTLEDYFRREAITQSDRENEEVAWENLEPQKIAKQPTQKAKTKYRKFKKRNKQWHRSTKSF